MGECALRNWRGAMPYHPATEQRGNGETGTGDLIYALFCFSCGLAEWTVAVVASTVPLQLLSQWQSSHCFLHALSLAHKTARGLGALAMLSAAADSRFDV
jgi:hypothetical protein